MDACEASGAKVTFFVEMCEVFWLEENDHETYERIAAQIAEIVRRGHDVQLHMHPNWMPELGACKTEDGYDWNWDYIHCDAVPGDLTGLVKRCKEKLEELARNSNPDYRCMAFRAGGYRVQPFSRIYEALKDSGITIDTSVYAGGTSGDRGYDFTGCKSMNQPYTAMKKDPSFVASGWSEIIELPIACYRAGDRVFIDNEESKCVARRLFNMPASCFSQEENYFTLIGHTKAEHDFEALSSQLVIWGGIPGTEFVTISECAEDIKHCVRSSSAQKASIKEVGEVISSLYDEIEPDNDNRTAWVGDILFYKKALCYGYVWAAATVLKMYGYDVRWVTAFANDMPKGRGRHMTDTHELIHLRLCGKDYIVCPTSKRILTGGMRKYIRNPGEADSGYWGDKEPDGRFTGRNYANYITSFFFFRLAYYTEAGVPNVPMPGGRRAFVRRKLWSLFHVRIPRMVKYYR